MHSSEIDQLEAIAAKKSISLGELVRTVIYHQVRITRPDVQGRPTGHKRPRRMGQRCLSMTISQEARWRLGIVAEHA
jgi:hypothetical protein